MKKYFYKKSFVLNSSKGFTLIEILVVIAIIGVLATLVVLAVLSPSKAKSSDAKITSQLSQMGSQAFLFGGTTSYNPSVIATPYQVSAGITGAAAGGTDSNGGTLFNDTTLANNSLYFLASKLPANTYVYYGWNGEPNATSGRWFFAASTSTGGFCVDWRNDKNTFTGTSLNGVLSNWTTAFPNAVAPTYSCN